MAGMVAAGGGAFGAVSTTGSFPNPWPADPFFFFFLASKTDHDDDAVLVVVVGDGVTKLETVDANNRGMERQNVI